MLEWFRKLLPHEEQFFDLFAQHSETVVSAAHSLNALLSGDDRDARIAVTDTLHLASERANRNSNLFVDYRQLFSEIKIIADYFKYSQPITQPLVCLLRRG